MGSAWVSCGMCSSGVGQAEVIPYGAYHWDWEVIRRYGLWSMGLWTLGYGPWPMGFYYVFCSGKGNGRASRVYQVRSSKHFAYGRLLVWN